MIAMGNLLRRASVIAGLMLGGFVAASCSSSESVSFGMGGGSTGTNYDASATRDQNVPEARTDTGGSCSKADYSFLRTCDSDAGPSNPISCTTSFDCAGTCCACPAHTDAGSADAGEVTSGGYRVFGCECGRCVTDTNLCARMLAGDPTLCP